jgi:hydroxymethylpyrimidine/phosphomethylpyrimidine kinase
MANSDTKVALTIAGSDSGGGAGIQADLKTFQAFGVFGTSAVTAVTAQNTRGVQDVHSVPVAVVRNQIDAVAQDLAPAAVKTGMLATTELVEAVADAIRLHRFSRYVMDPVMVATSGHRLLDERAVSAVIQSLLPLTDLVTPNLAEAAVLVGAPVANEADMRGAARSLVRMGAGAALIKGGHLPGDAVVDVLWDGEEEHVHRRPRLETVHTHGTGCTLSAAVAACLARGLPLRESVERALDYVHRAIADAPHLGSGHGPLNHWVPAFLDGRSAGQEHE